LFGIPPTEFPLGHPVQVFDTALDGTGRRARGDLRGTGPLQEAAVKVPNAITRPVARATAWRGGSEGVGAAMAGMAFGVNKSGLRTYRNAAAPVMSFLLLPYHFPLLLCLFYGDGSKNPARTGRI